MLEQMERALVAEDPKLASTLRGTTMAKMARRRAILAGVVFVAGIAILTAGVITSQPVIGIVGFVVMLASAAVGVTAVRSPAMHSEPVRQTRHSGFGVVDGGRPSRPRRTRHADTHGSFMERMEERWRRRREQGF